MNTIEDFMRPVDCPECGTIGGAHSVSGSFEGVRNSKLAVDSDTRQSEEILCTNCGNQFVAIYSPNKNGVLFETSGETKFREGVNSTAINFSIDKESCIEYDIIVRYGPPLEVKIMSQEEFGHYVNGERYRYVDRLSSENLTDDVISGRLDSGDYTFDIRSHETTEESKFEYHLKAEYLCSEK